MLNFIILVSNKLYTPVIEFFFNYIFAHTLNLLLLCESLNLILKKKYINNFSYPLTLVYRKKSRTEKFKKDEKKFYFKRFKSLKLEF